MMKKFIASLILFLSVALVFYISVIFIWGTFARTSLKPNLNYKIGSKGHMFTRMQEAKKISNVDVLFLGSSHAYRGFDPRVFEKYDLTTFNMGSSSQTPVQTLVLLKRCLDKINPKSVIYEVYPETFMIDGIESSLDLIANDKNDRYSWGMAFKLNHIKTYNTLIYGVIQDVFNLNASYVESRDKKEDHYVKDGFVEMDLKYYTEKSFPKKKIIINGKQLESFEKIIKELELRNIKVSLVFAPVAPNFYSSYSNIKHFDSIMRSYATYYNFNKRLDLKKNEYFYDYHHLNQNGVVFFNEKLIQTLINKKE